MKKYYTRACNFFYGQRSKELIKKKLTLPLCGNNSISFNQIEIFIRDKKRVKSKIINIKRINKLNPSLKKTSILYFALRYSMILFVFWLAKIRKPTMDSVRKTEKMVAKEVNFCLKIFLKPSAIKNENLSILRPHRPILNFNNSVTSAFN